MTEELKLNARELQLKMLFDEQEKRIEELEKELEQEKKLNAEIKARFVKCNTCTDEMKDKCLMFLENLCEGERCEELVDLMALVSQNDLQKENEQLKEQIADIKANCDLAIEGRDVKIMELEKGCEETQELLDKQIEATYKLDKKNAELTERLEDLQEQNSEMFNTIALQEQQIEKMKCCGNCNGHCSWTSESIKDGKRTSHYWNKEKKAYCDVGEGAEYQLWEMRK